MKEYNFLVGVVKRTTPRAILFLHGSLEEHWIPRSVIENGDDVEEGSCTIEVEQWFCEKEGIEF